MTDSNTGRFIHRAETHSMQYNITLHCSTAYYQLASLNSEHCGEPFFATELSQKQRMFCQVKPTIVWVWGGG
ncbi:unnamed protein product [Chondrus crispus]|uniref:Uncharacterized protein n=1 Tax=Chondrus crispus TaxID=2769 RepID=R7QM62_CHOCR|nr:unnamed protein product [Chondrus crispus]CDF38561.1 unnamed protein product [Chondrus crispus]|eukprot:XP_005718454.1 unnamed protein product [Chondrus crispus]